MKVLDKCLVCGSSNFQRIDNIHSCYMPERDCVQEIVCFNYLVCKECGYLHTFANDESLEMLKKQKQRNMSR